MKFFGVVSILGNVTRIVPKRTEEKENKIYYEFLDFYRLAPINYIWFSEEGSFAKLPAHCLCPHNLICRNLHKPERYF